MMNTLSSVNGNIFYALQNLTMLGQLISMAAYAFRKKPKHSEDQTGMGLDGHKEQMYNLIFELLTRLNALIGCPMTRQYGLTHDMKMVVDKFIEDVKSGKVTGKGFGDGRVHIQTEEHRADMGIKHLIKSLHITNEHVAAQLRAEMYELIVAALHTGAGLETKEPPIFFHPATEEYRAQAGIKHLLESLYITDESIAGPLRAKLYTLVVTALHHGYGGSIHDSDGVMIEHPIYFEPESEEYIAKQGIKHLVASLHLNDESIAAPLREALFVLIVRILHRDKELGTSVFG